MARNLVTCPLSGKGAATLRRILEHRDHHVLVVDIGWQRFAPAYALARLRPLQNALPEVRAWELDRVGGAVRLRALVGGLPGTGHGGEAGESASVEDRLESASADQGAGLRPYLARPRTQRHDPGTGQQR
ncbi:hypothetical protein [Streptomyces sp. NPDC054786]